MSVANQTLSQLYTATGAQTSFAIPCAFSPTLASAQIAVYLVDLATGVMTRQQESAFLDYTLTPPYNSITNPAGPTTVVFNVAPAAGNDVWVGRETDIVQDLGLSSAGNIPPKAMENLLDKVVLSLQEVGHKADMALRINVLEETTVSPLLPPVIPDNVLVVNSAGTGFEFLDTSVLVGPAGATGPAGTPGAGGVPAGGATGEFLEKLSATDGDADWMNADYVGFSSRYGAVNLLGLKATLDFLMDMTRLGPTISLAMAGGSGTVREIGTSIASSMMSATVTKRSDPIAQVRFYQGATLVNTIAVPNPAGGVETYNYATAFSTTKSFTAQVDDNGATGGPSTVTSNTVTWTFIYPYYWGAGVAGKTAAQVAALTKVVATKPSTLTFTAAGGGVFYVAILASQGAYTSIKDSLGFETITDWTRTTQNITGLDATAQSYYIYEFNNVVIAGSYLYTFT